MAGAILAVALSHRNNYTKDGLKRYMVSQEQEQQQEQVQIEENAQSNESNVSSTPKKVVRRRVVKKVTAVSEEAISPRPSIWPLALAFSIVVFLYGALGNEIIMFVGIAMVIASVIGWGLERR